MATTGTWYVNAAGAVVNWSSAVASGVAQFAIFEVDVVSADGYPQTTLWAAAGTPVSAAQVAAAQAGASAGSPPAVRPAEAVNSSGSGGAGGSSSTVTVGNASSAPVPVATPSGTELTVAADAVGMLVRTVQEAVRDDFPPSALSSLWSVVQTGSGMAVDLTTTPSVLRITTGTTASQETILRSTRSWRTPVRAIFYSALTALLSQRIANQEIEFRLTNTAGTSYVSWLFSGTSATSATIRSCHAGVLATDTTATTLDTGTGSPAFELEAFADEVYFHCRKADDTSTRANSYVRNRRIPDDTDDLWIEIHVRNLATAPASSTTLTLDAVTLQDIVENTTEVTAGRGGGAQSQAVPVAVLNTPAVTVSSTVSLNVFQSGTTVTSTAIGASLTYTQSSVDMGSGSSTRDTRIRYLYSAAAAALGSMAYVVLQESTDASSWKETGRMPLPADGAYHSWEWTLHSRYYRTYVVNGSTAQTSLFLSSMTVRGEGASTDTDINLPFPLTPAGGTVLAANAAITGPTLDLGTNHAWDRIRATAMNLDASASGTLAVQVSQDQTNWRNVGAGAAVAASSAASLSVDVGPFRYLRVVYTNGATAASAGLVLASSLLSL